MTAAAAVWRPWKELSGVKDAWRTMMTFAVNEAHVPTVVAV